MIICYFSIWHQGQITVQWCTVNLTANDWCTANLTYVSKILYLWAKKWGLFFICVTVQSRALLQHNIKSLPLQNMLRNFRTKNEYSDSEKSIFKLLVLVRRFELTWNVELSREQFQKKIEIGIIKVVCVWIFWHQQAAFVMVASLFASAFDLILDKLEVPSAHKVRINFLIPKIDIERPEFNFSQWIFFGFEIFTGTERTNCQCDWITT